jgi:hypothetical protein
MKKIVNGKRYDTKTAEVVTSYSNDYPTNDFNWYEESLYKTKSGNWFLAGEGGPMSKYSVSCGNSTSGGSNLIPLTKDEAKEWLEEHNESDALEIHFKDDIVDA